MNTMEEVAKSVAEDLEALVKNIDNNKISNVIVEKMSSVVLDEIDHLMTMGRDFVFIKKLLESLGAGLYKRSIGIPKNWSIKRKERKKTKAEILRNELYECGKRAFDLKKKIAIQQKTVE